MARLALCAFAIEARANHLILEGVQSGEITEDEARKYVGITADARWKKLPFWRKKGGGVKCHSFPHLAIRKIWKHRNKIVHVKYEEFFNALPSKNEVLKLFQEFVNAMEDMNVVLGRIPAMREEVLNIGRIS